MDFPLIMAINKNHNYRTFLPISLDLDSSPLRHPSVNEGESERAKEMGRKITARPVTRIPGEIRLTLSSKRSSSYGNSNREKKNGQKGKISRKRLDSSRN